MPLLAFVQRDDPAALARYRRARRRRLLLAWSVLGLALAATVLLSSLVRRHDLASLLTELGTFLPFVLVFAVLASQEQPERRRVMLLGGAWAGTALLANAATKLGLTRTFYESGVADQPRLLLGLLFLLAPAAFFLLAARSAPLQRWGLRPQGLGRQLLAGLLAGAIFVVHFFATIQFSGVVGLRPPPVPTLVWTLGYEGYQSLAEELFFRGVIFQLLHRQLRWDVWQATALATLANLSIYLVRSNYHNPIEVAGLVLFISMLSVGSCLLFKRYQSVLPGYIANVMLGLAFIFRG